MWQVKNMPKKVLHSNNIQYMKHMAGNEGKIKGVINT